MPDVKQLREKGSKAASDAETFFRENAESWDAEKQAKFNAMIKDSTDAQKEILAIEAREAQLKQLAEHKDFWDKPVASVTEPPVETDKKPDPKETQSRVRKEAFAAYVREGDSGLARYLQTQSHVAPQELHALVSNDNTLGGFLVPEDWRNEVLKAAAGFAVLAPLCRTEGTNRDALVWPKLAKHASDSRRTSGFTGQFQSQGYVTGGTAPTVQNYPTFEQERIPVHSWQPDAVEVSPELMADSGANLESIIQECIAETLAFDKDDKILDGDGVMEPEGVLNSGASTVNSGDADGIGVSGLIGLYTGVPAQYRPGAVFVMDSTTMGAVIQLNTGTGGVYFFPPNQWNNTILGHKVVYMDYGMDTATAEGGTTFTAGEHPIIFGNFRYYIIAERQELRVQRLVERFAPNTGFLPTARLGGQVVQTDAFRILTVAA